MVSILNSSAYEERQKKFAQINREANIESQMRAIRAHELEERLGLTHKNSRGSSHMLGPPKTISNRNSKKTGGWTSERKIKHDMLGPPGSRPPSTSIDIDGGYLAPPALPLPSSPFISNPLAKSRWRIAGTKSRRVTVKAPTNEAEAILMLKQAQRYLKSKKDFPDHLISSKNKRSNKRSNKKSKRGRSKKKKVSTTDTEKQSIEEDSVSSAVIVDVNENANNKIPKKKSNWRRAMNKFSLTSRSKSRDKKKKNDSDNKEVVEMVGLHHHNKADMFNGEFKNNENTNPLYVKKSKKKEEHIDDQSGRRYSYNPATSESTWLDEEKDVDVRVDEVTGKRYVWNLVTKTPTWLDEFSDEEEEEEKDKEKQEDKEQEQEQQQEQEQEEEEEMYTYTPTMTHNPMNATKPKKRRSIVEVETDEGNIYFYDDPDLGGTGESAWELDELEQLVSLSKQNHIN